MEEDLNKMTREELIDEVKKLRQGIRKHRDSRPLLAPSFTLGPFAGKDRPDPYSTGLARVYQRLCEVSAVAGRTGTKRPADQ